MNAAKNNLVRFLKKVKSIFLSTYLSCPRKVQCNVCKWEGRHFISDRWQSHISCPKCGSGIRQRLFVASLENISDFSYEKLIYHKIVLHFAPEYSLSSIIRNKSANYVTADFLRHDCDLRIDISNLSKIKDGCYDIVIAFDVLEHVPNYKAALEEIHRILLPQGFAIFTVPQKDNLSVTYEDSTINSPEDRKKHFGQWDHLRIFGDDFSDIVKTKGFNVTAVNESMFSQEMVNKNVLFPPVLSKYSLATNYRKIFFCQKM